MIERYSRKELKDIWSDYNKYSIWLNIELAAAEAMERLKIIPKGVVKKVKSKAKINVKRILYIESKVKHDVIAFLTSITEKSGKESRYLHKGMTSSDVLDTCFNLQLKQSGEILLKDIEEYVSKTYQGHYTGAKHEFRKVQTIDLMAARDIATDFCQANILKYGSRYGSKNGKNKTDLLKVIHYAMLLLHFDGHYGEPSMPSGNFDQMP